jgi:N-formylglutamate amidohydrolase
MRLALAALLLVTVQTPKPAELVTPANLVTVQRGTLPILICAPHGGGARIAGVERRKGPTEGTKTTDTFTTDQDVRTAELAWIVSERMTAELGQKPNVVVAQFHRRYADANRPASEGTECDAARAEHEAYHRAIRSIVDDLRAHHEAVLLVDLHGQAREPGAIVRGTRDGKSVAALIARDGVTAITGPEGLFGWLEAHDVVVVPSNRAHPDVLSDETFFEGGHTVATYGSNHKDGVDAVQIEVGSNLRAPGALWKTGDTLAEALSSFARRHLGVAAAAAK